MGAKMHVWVGDEDPFELPLGGVTIFIHQGTPDDPGGSPGGVPGTGGDQGGSGTPWELKDPTPGGDLYTNLIRGVTRIGAQDGIESVLNGRAGPEVGIELPDISAGGTGGREKVFKSILDGLRSTEYGDITVHLIRTSDLPPVDD